MIVQCDAKSIEQQENIKDRDMKKRQRNRYSVQKLGYVSTKKVGPV